MAQRGQDGGSEELPQPGLLTLVSVEAQNRADDLGDQFGELDVGLQVDAVRS